MHPIKIILRRVATDIRQNRMAILLILIYLAVTQYLFHRVCPWLILTRRPCPACGLTRAALLLFTCRFADAWRMNPAVYLWVPFLLYLCLCRYLFGKKTVLAIPLTIAVCIATVAVHLWRYL